MSTLAAITYGLKADGQRNPAASGLGDAMRALADAADHETNRACVVTYELRRLAACAHALDGVAEAIAAVRAAREALDAAKVATLDAERVYATALAHAAASGEVEP